MPQKKKKKTDSDTSYILSVKRAVTNVLSSWSL